MPKARANGIDIAYEEMGEGEPLVLIMGIGAQLVHWPEDFCQMLVDRGFRVIRFDNRDTGGSSWMRQAPVPRVRRAMARRLLGLRVDAAYTLEDMADDVAGLLDALGIDSAHVLGVSMGGMIAQTLAIRHPKRVRSLTSMMSTTGSRLHSYVQPKALRALLASPPKSREQAIDRAVEFFRVVGGSGFDLDEADIRRRAAKSYDRGLNPRGFARQMGAIFASGSRRRALRQVRVPTLVLHGSEDPLIPPSGGRATARAIPGAELKVIEGMGHNFPRDTWPTIADGVQRLAERTRSAA